MSMIWLEEDSGLMKFRTKKYLKKYLEFASFRIVGMKIFVGSFA